MKKKLLYFISPLLAGICLSHVQAQTMTLSENNGSKTSYDLNTVRKISFTEGTMEIKKNDGQGQTYDLGAVRHLTFSGIVNGTADAAGTSSVSIYPNPAIQELSIVLANMSGEFFDVSVSDIRGNILLVKKLSAVDKLDVSKLEKGIYYCRISQAGKTETVKFVKE